MFSCGQIWSGVFGILLFCLYLALPSCYLHLYLLMFFLRNIIYCFSLDPAATSAQSSLQVQFVSIDFCGNFILQTHIVKCRNDNLEVILINLHFSLATTLIRAIHSLQQLLSLCSENKRSIQLTFTSLFNLTEFFLRLDYFIVQYHDTSR